MTRSLESVLEPRAYRVLRAHTGAEALERARREQPDLIVIASHLPDLTGEAVCSQLRQDPSLPPRIPIIGLTATAPSRKERLTWLRAGAWDFLGLPLDAEELLLKVDQYVDAKRQRARPRDVVLVDQATGLYNEQGLKRRARELVAQALRSHDAVACVLFGPALRAGERRGKLGAEELAAVRAHVGSVVQAHARLSDAVGWWNGSEFAVLAPGTDAHGARKLAQRMAHAIETAPAEPGVSVPALEVRAGYEGVSDAHATPVEPEDLLARASAALRLARRTERGGRIRRFEAGQ